MDTMPPQDVWKLSRRLNALQEANHPLFVAATAEQMSAARLPLAYRDTCAHLLIPLNRCRQEEYYLPWKCEV
jgi:hypothetical protein